jgi:hypothetical protein
VGLGRLYNQGYQAMPTFCNGGGDGIQLVEFVRAFGKSKSSHGGHYITTTFAVWGWTQNYPRRPAIFDHCASHGKASQAIYVLTKVSLLLKEWKSIAEQSTLKTVWFQVCKHIAKLVTGLNWLAPIESPMQIEIKPG